MSCPYCDKAASGAVTGMFDRNCSGCGFRHIQMITCKIQRVPIAKLYHKSGKTPDIKASGHCGCDKQCKRKVAAKAAGVRARGLKEGVLQIF